MPRAIVSSSKTGSVQVPRSALRLLAALSEPGSSARADPSREGFVIIGGEHAGVSLGRGGHPAANLDLLDRRGLVERDGRAFVITVAGRARLAREAGGREAPADEAFGRQHRDLAKALVPSPSGGDEVAVNMRESPLVWLRRRRGQDGEPLIDAAAFEAGERLRRDLTFAGILPSVTARWDGAIGGGAGASRDPAGATDTVIAARQRVRAALTAVGGDFAGLLVDLCGFLKGVETIERERRWPQRSGKIVVRLALAQLARHYGLSSEASGRPSSGGVRTWLADLDAA